MVAEEGRTTGQELLLRGDLVLKILQHSSWEDRARVMGLCKGLRDMLLRDDRHWEWMCGQLRSESFVHLPKELCEETWRKAFDRYFHYRQMFNQQLSSPKKRLAEAAVSGNIEALSSETEDLDIEDCVEDSKGGEQLKNSFNIKVCARMRPLPPYSAKGPANAKDVGANVVLPLHQRLGLIRQQHKCSAAEARRILWQGETKPDPWATSEVRVVEPKEKIEEDEEKVQMQKDDVQACVVAVNPGLQGSVLMCCPGTGLREFNFDSVLGEISQQSDVYRSAAAPLVSDFINGVNGCVFSYGQTGSGKTHTMFGPDLKAGTCVHDLDSEKAGIVPRACADVVNALADRKKKGIATSLSVSYVEIYGDAVTDLLKAGETVGMWHGVAHHAVFTGECSVEVQSPEEMSELLERGDAVKRRAATAMNDRSSRAHSLLILSLNQMHKESSVEVHSTLVLADLGGSEKVEQSGVNKLSEVAGGFLSADDRLKEAVYINLGLLSLKTCIRNLLDNNPYVPFQNSRLTMMLSSALGGNCKTAVVVTGSSEKKHALETLHSLRFGEECGQIVNQTKDGMGAAARAIKALDQEIEKVEEEIRRKERWETVREKRIDELHQEDEATQREEIKTTSKLVGAEAEREHLELLLSRRRILVGA